MCLEILLKLQNLIFIVTFLVEVEALKHAPTWGLKHRRDSISGLSTHSQPMNFAFGTHSPAPTYHSGFYLTFYCYFLCFFDLELLILGMYTPGMMTDVVREVKEAARVREDALLNRYVLFQFQCFLQLFVAFQS